MMSVRLTVVEGHVGTERDHVQRMKTPTVGIKVFDDLKGSHLSVEGVGVLEIVVPYVEWTVASMKARRPLSAALQLS